MILRSTDDSDYLTLLSASPGNVTIEWKHYDTFDAEEDISATIGEFSIKDLARVARLARDLDSPAKRAWPFGRKKD